MSNLRTVEGTVKFIKYKSPVHRGMHTHTRTHTHTHTHTHTLHRHTQSDLEVLVHLISKESSRDAGKRN